MSKDKGPLVVPPLGAQPSPLLRQASRKMLDDSPNWRHVPAVPLSSQPPPEMLPQKIICDDPVQVGPIVVVYVITLHLHQKLVGPGWVKYFQICNLLHGGRMGPAQYVCSLAYTDPQYLLLPYCVRRPLASRGAALHSSVPSSFVISFNPRTVSALHLTYAGATHQ